MLVLALCHFPVTAVRAGTFAPLSVEDLAARSDLIVVGVVEDVEAHPVGPHGLDGIHSRIRVAVDEVLSGSASRQIEFWVQGGRLYNQLRVVTGQATFEKGESLVLFLFRDAHGARWPSGLARGKWHLLGKGQERWVTPSVALDGSEDASAVQVSSSGAFPSLTLVELRARVRRARAVTSRSR